MSNEYVDKQMAQYDLEVWKQSREGRTSRPQPVMEAEVVYLPREKRPVRSLNRLSTVPTRIKPIKKDTFEAAYVNAKGKVLEQVPSLKASQIRLGKSITGERRAYMQTLLNTCKEQEGY